VPFFSLTNSNHIRGLVSSQNFIVVLLKLSKFVVISILFFDYRNGGIKYCLLEKRHRFESKKSLQMLCEAQKMGSEA